MIIINYQGYQFLGNLKEEYLQHQVYVIIIFWFSSSVCNSYLSNWSSKQQMILSGTRNSRWKIVDQKLAKNAKLCHENYVEEFGFFGFDLQQSTSS